MALVYSYIFMRQFVPFRWSTSKAQKRCEFLKALYIFPMSLFTTQNDSITTYMASPCLVLFAFPPGIYIIHAKGYT